MTMEESASKKIKTKTGLSFFFLFCLKLMLSMSVCVHKGGSNILESHQDLSSSSASTCLYRNLPFPFRSFQTPFSWRILPPFRVWTWSSNEAHCFLSLGAKSSSSLSPSVKREFTWKPVNGSDTNTRHRDFSARIWSETRCDRHIISTETRYFSSFMSHWTGFLVTSYVPCIVQDLLGQKNRMNKNWKRTAIKGKEN